MATSTSSTSLQVSNNRITGLASGLDTDTIIQGLLSTYQTKIDKVDQNITKDGWIEDQYRSINTQVTNFTSTYMSVLSDSNMMTGDLYEAYKTSMLTDSNAVTVSASSSASACTMTVNSISQLAAAAAVSSTGALTGSSYSSSTTLANLSLSTPLQFDDDGNISFSINGTSFSFSKDTTIGSMMSQINSSNAGVKMTYSTLTGGFTLKSTSTGSSSSLVISNTSGNAFSSSDSAFGLAEGTYTGQDAKCTINNISVTQSSNTFTYDGITYTLNDTSDSAIKFNVTQDVDTPVAKIEAFVTAYNTLVDQLQSKIAETYDSNYPPLTDTQKKSLSDDDITTWNTKAQTGLLHDDQYVTSLLSTLRNALYTTVEGTGVTPSDIGLNTGTYSDGAKITLDEDTLRSALQKDPNKVNSIFVANGSDSASQGLITRISNAMLNYTQNVTKIPLADLKSQVTDLGDKKDTLTSQMDDQQTQLYNKFSSMESSLSQLSSMSNWLSSMFSSSSS